jgi:SHS2 domain-containing protein
MFELFEHKADVGIRGKGNSLEEAFAECGKALFSVMVELDKVKAEERVEVKVEADDKEQLLVNFLNELLYLKDVKEMVFKEFELRIIEENGKWRLEGRALGEKINKEKHTIKGDVKAASFHQLKVSEEKGQFVVQCVVDV